jgi:hypothetical protein
MPWCCITSSITSRNAFNRMDGPVTIQSSSSGRGLTASVRVPPLCMVLVGYVQLHFPRAEVSAVYRRARRYAPSCAVSGRDYGCVRVGEPSHAVVANVLHCNPCIPCATNTYYHQVSGLEKKGQIKLINLHHLLNDPS